MKALTPQQVKAKAQRDAMLYIYRQHPKDYTLKYRDGQLVLYKNIQLRFGILLEPELWLMEAR